MKQGNRGNGGTYTPRPRTPYRTSSGYLKRKKRRRTIVLGAGILFVLGVALAFWLVSRSLHRSWRPGELPPGPPYVIALDAGHGGEDLGAIGFIEEVQITETTVSKLNELLANDPNYKTVLCRKPGEAATIAERVKHADKKSSVLLLSVHANADTAGTATGFECYPAPPGRKWHEESLYFGNLLAEEMALAGSPLRGEGGIRYVFYQKDGEGESTKVFHEASETPILDMPSFGIVDSPDCPAVLVEQCFVTNEMDVAAFGTEEGCQRAAESYYKAICRYFETEPVNV